MKRYVIEFANDAEKSLTAAGRTEAAGRVLKIRNAYISYMCGELDALKMIIAIMEG